MRQRIYYLLLAIAMIPLGLASRHYRDWLPNFLATYSGDTLWALMLYFIISAILAERTMVTRTTVAMIVATLVEISQLYHAPWLDGLRQNKLGALVLGQGFLWSDLGCYAIGIAMGAGGEWLLNQMRERPTPTST